ncbi:hypothetical protein SAZ11_00790 [Streptomyces sp. FXJ1.4098]|nr:hypothetical protein [Streptomyces sp. FXJ1.4098]
MRVDRGRIEKDLDDIRVFLAVAADPLDGVYDDVTGVVGRRGPREGSVGDGSSTPAVTRSIRICGLPPMLV